MLKNPFFSATIFISTRGRRLQTIISKEGGIAIASNALPRIIIISEISFFVWERSFLSKYIPAGSSPGLTRAPGQPLSGTYIGCSVLHNVPVRPTFSVYRCNRRRCATCAVIKPLRFFWSSLTNRRYTVISVCDLSCSTTNVIYLISCAKCDQQYLGETKQKGSARLSGHRFSIKKHANTFIARHFNLPGHTMDDIRIQPIEHITQNPEEIERDVTIRRLDRERFWMLELGTLYPYGLNDRLQHVGNVRSRNNVFNLFNRHQRRKRSHMHGHRSNSSCTSEITLDLLCNLYNSGQGHGSLHRLLTTLHSADKAGNNIIFVCKYYYIRTLMEELGINSVTNVNSTYVNQDNTVDELIQTHATALEDVFDIGQFGKYHNTLFLFPQIFA